MIDDIKENVFTIDEKQTVSREKLIIKNKWKF